MAPMPHITLDPSLERPYFTSVAFDAVCTALATAEGIEKEAVAAWLVDAWDPDNNTRREAWADQVREDKAAAAEARLAHKADQLQELAQIMRSHGIGPISKWVDDHIFFRILHCHLDEYNLKRRQLAQDITGNGGELQDGGRLWFKGAVMPDDQYEEFDEDSSCAV